MTDFLIKRTPFDQHIIQCPLSMYHHLLSHPCAMHIVIHNLLHMQTLFPPIIYSYPLSMYDALPMPNMSNPYWSKILNSTGYHHGLLYSG